MMTLLMAGCASTKVQKINATTYSITCSGEYSSCTQKADTLCGVDRYKILSDTETTWCAGEYGGSHPCAWRKVVQCEMNAGVKSP